MKCMMCNTSCRSGSNFYDDEIICETCGASFTLELAGYYPEGCDERIDCGKEFEEWKKRWAKAERSYTVKSVDES